MARIGFVGLGNMGGPMAANLLKAGHDVVGIDIDPAAMQRHADNGGAQAGTIPELAQSSDIIITMLPTGRHVQEVYMGEGGILKNARMKTLLIDSSTIDVVTARLLAEKAEISGMLIVDAPVSGGIWGAEAASLTYMVGGTEEAFALAEPILQHMGTTIVHAGGAGNGQAAKICNNMVLGVSMIAVSEAFVLAEKLGLDRQKFFDISSTASSQCWAMTTYCPVPGPVPTSPANKDYEPGFTADMMVKDMTLAQSAAQSAGVSTPMGAEAAALYGLYAKSGEGEKDFSGIVRFIRGKDESGS